MKANMGSADRIIRIVLAIVIGILYFTNTITGLLGTLLLIVAVAFLLTSLISWCPFYMPFKINTAKKK
jgi:hypothetical protein